MSELDFWGVRGVYVYVHVVVYVHARDMILGPEATIRSLSPMSTNPAGFGQFSNNNYMPGIGLPCATHFSSPGSLGGSSVPTSTTNTVSSCNSAVSSPILSPPGPPSSLFLNYGGLPSAQHIQTGFTFTSPTQSYSLMGSPPVSIMHGGLSPHSQHLNLHYHHHLGANPYLQTSAATTPSTAPGVGVTWQHTVPSSMPWVQTNSITPNPVCFSDVMSSSSIITGTDPKPSCSCSPRRPKRRGTDMYEEADMFQMPPNKVCLSEEKVAQQLQELSIDPNACLSRNKSCGISSEDKDRHMPYKHPGNWRGINSEAESMTSNEKTSKLSSMRNDGQSFKNVLPRKLLQEIIDEDENASSEKTQRSLHIVEDLSNDILAPKTVLPRKILQEIISPPAPKPCLDVVLWRPPDVLANVLKSSPEDTLTTESMSDSPSSGESSLPKRALNLPDISLLPFTATSISQTFNDITFTAEDDDIMDI